MPAPAPPPWPTAAKACDVRSKGSTGNVKALATINRLVDQQAYMLAVNDVFYASAMIFLLLIPVVWLSRPKRAGGASADAGAGAH